MNSTDEVFYKCSWKQQKAITRVPEGYDGSVCVYDVEFHTVDLRETARKRLAKLEGKTKE